MSETLIRTAERLAALIEEETLRLKSPAPGEIAGIQAQKADLARIWAEGLARLKTEKPLAEPQRTALVTAAERLDAALVRNERVLRAATMAADRVVSAIAEAVREQRSCGVGYGMRRQAPRTRAPASGISVDRKL
jgi:hypothetical protein